MVGCASEIYFTRRNKKHESVMDGEDSFPQTNSALGEGSTKHKKHKRAKTTVPDNDRCVANTQRGRCANQRKAAGELCSHHAADVARGCTTSKRKWMAAGIEHLKKASFLPLSKQDPLVALRFDSVYTERVVNRLVNIYCCEHVYTEESQKGRVVLMLFRAPPHSENILPRLGSDSIMPGAMVGTPALVTSSTDSIQVVKDAALAAARKAADNQDVVRIICQNNSTQKEIVEYIGKSDKRACEHGVSLQGYSHVMSVFTLFDDVHFFGVYPRYSVSEGTCGREMVICRAEHKIREAIETSGWELKATWRALDIGAAPGGWTFFLAGLLPQGKVFAVDPAEMSKQVLELDNVVHIKAMAGVPGSPVSETVGQEGVDLCVCDMNADPRQVARLFRSLGDDGILRRGARVILTLKMVFKGHASRKLMEEEARDILKSSFSEVSVAHLFANTANEATLMARWCGPATS